MVPELFTVYRLLLTFRRGEVRERFIRAVSKTVVAQVTVSSNLTLSAILPSQRFHFPGCSEHMVAGVDGAPDRREGPADLRAAAEVYKPLIILTSALLLDTQTR